MKNDIACKLGLCLLSCCCTMLVWAQGISSQTNDIRQLVERADAQVGVAVIVDGKDTLSFNNEVHYPLMSVMKFHQALAVCHFLQLNDQNLDMKVHVPQQSLKSDTYSPLKKRYPTGDLTLTVKDLLDYSLKMSDNNACDILFGLIGGPETVDRYIRSLGLNQFAISVTEDDMHRRLEDCYRNWTTPLDAAILLDNLINNDITDIDDQGYIRQAMLDCETGKDRLWKPLEKTGARLGHKTGTGDRNHEGKLIGVNDIGFVFLPDGRHYTIAVMVKDAGMSLQSASKLIADISEVVYLYVSSQSVEK